MSTIYRSNDAALNKPAAITNGQTMGWFRHANPALGIEASTITADFLNYISGNVGYLLDQKSITYNMEDMSQLYNATTSSGWLTQSVADTRYVLKAGDTMTGRLTLSADPISNLHASTKQYADTKLALTGGTLSGYLTLHANPVNPMHAATKSYVDDRRAPGWTRLSWNDRIDVGVATYHNVFADVKTISFATPASCSLMFVNYRANCHHNATGGKSIDWRLLYDGNVVATSQSNPNGADNMTFQLPMSFITPVTPNTTKSITLQAYNYDNTGNVWTNGGQNASTNIPLGTTEIDILFF